VTEDQFVAQLTAALVPRLLPHKTEQKRSLLYDLSFDHRGVVSMGVDPDTGEPIRGRGRGFEQDILVFDEVGEGHTSVVPRVVVEVKLGGVTTHDVIVYSEKADRIRRVYPYLRYGFVLGGMRSIPGRVLRLGQRFDFIAAIGEELPADEFGPFADMVCAEARASIALTEVLFEKAQNRSTAENSRSWSRSRLTAAGPVGGLAATS
jgi:hypothetical protein